MINLSTVIAVVVTVVAVVAARVLAGFPPNQP